MIKKLLFSLLTIVLLAGCAGKGEITIPVYVWQSWGDKTTEASLKSDFGR